MQSRLISKSESRLEDGTETTLIFETIGANGAKRIHKAYVRRVESGNSYKIFSTFGVSWFADDASTSDGTPWVSLQCTITEGVKGEVDGDHRTDTIRLTTICSDGTILQNPPATVRVLLHTPTSETMSFQEMVDWVETKMQAGLACELTNLKVPEGP